MDPNAQFAHAREAIRAGDFVRAESLLRALHAAVGDEPLVLSMLGVALRRLGRIDEALAASARALERAPGHPGVLVNHGNVLLDAGRPSDAAEALSRAVAIAPGVAEARVGLSRALTLLGRMLDAADVCREGLVGAPDHPKLLANLGAALLYAGCGDAAIAAYERGAARWPEDLTLAMGLAAALAYAGDDDPDRVATVHRRAGAIIAREQGTHEPPAIVDPDPQRPLRIGLMCADFRAHASAFFLDPILRHADRDRVAYHLYSTGTRDDAVTERFQGWAAAFNRVGDLDPPTLAARVRSDRIDILLDLSGYAEGQRLAAFQRRCAPLQGTYLAYASTTGLPAMDFHIVDAITDRPGEAEAFNAERLVRIEPCLLAYAIGGGLPGGAADVPEVAHAHAPESSRPPAPAASLASASAVTPTTGFTDASASVPPTASKDPARPITFGSFRGLQLVTERTLNLWASVLRGVPGSRMLVKNHGLGGERERAYTLDRFIRAGVDASRVLLEGPAPGAAAMLREYARLDICLDSFPYSGTTTVCESLSMGVPMVTLSGRTSASRVCESILRAAGVAEFVARDDESFVRLAAGLAGDPSRLATLRRELPARFAASAACDGAAFARRFEAALRSVWTDACHGTPTHETKGRA